MRKHQLFCLLLTLLCIPLQAQVSFGIKAGANLLSINLTSTNIATQYTSFLRDLESNGINLGTAGNARLDSFNNTGATSLLPIRMEFGVYCSVPITKRANLKLDISYHRLNTMYGTADNETTLTFDPSSEIKVLGRSAFVYTDMVDASFIRPTLLYQRYFGQNVAASIGISYSIPRNDVIESGNSHLVFSVQEASGNILTTQITDRYRRVWASSKRGIPGINIGYLISIGSLIKIESRLTHYFPPLKGSDLIKDRTIIAGLGSTLDYDIRPYEYGFTYLSMFIEL